jgi:hypothetical protein
MKLSLLLIAFRLVLMLFRILLKHHFTHNMLLIIHPSKGKQGLQLLSFIIAKKTEGSHMHDCLALQLNLLQL